MPVSLYFFKVTFQDKTTLEVKDKSFKLFYFFKGAGGNGEERICHRYCVAATAAEQEHQ